MAQQVIFSYPGDTRLRHGGFLLDNGDLLCACCGGIFPQSDEGSSWSIIKIFDDWVNLDGEIIGDEPMPDDDTDSQSTEELAAASSVSAEEFDAVYE